MRLCVGREQDGRASLPDVSGKDISDMAGRGRGLQQAKRDAKPVHASRRGRGVRVDLGRGQSARHRRGQRPASRPRGRDRPSFARAARTPALRVRTGARVLRRAPGRCTISSRALPRQPGLCAGRADGRLGRGSSLDDARPGSCPPRPYTGIAHQDCFPAVPRAVSEAQGDKAPVPVLSSTRRGLHDELIDARCGLTLLLGA